MKIRKIITSHKYGFTLVEIVIVAALVALFSGLATFGIQQMLRNNKLKAVIGEARQVGSSLIFAHQDIGFYPSIGFLNMSKAVIDGRF
ncbi:MAG TPA: prepilin-type N-terminal cleavage/methylation domain-containing protein, partial [Candidatus Sumerlaeia bacterium]|nr:prepilin-type N-terminal cleavage/methylation domain-containing protein [Candidatus Sumerlaeia bacterium]